MYFGMSDVIEVYGLMRSIFKSISKPDQFVTNTYWKENVRQPVQFQQAVQNSAAPSTLNIFLEIGPKPVLKAHLSDSFNESKAVDLISMNVNSERVSIMESLAALYMYGIDLNMERINPYTSITSDICKIQQLVPN
jgi:acyl transferase domain-containing protein